jgi:iron complex transport system permease protein
MKLKTARYVIILIIILAVLMIIGASIGAASLPITSVVKIISSKIPILKNFINMQGIDLQDIKIILDIRLPRVLMAVLVGIALSSSGVIFQGIFRNPMADPYILGVSAGAAFGATIGLIFAKGTKLLNFSLTSIFAFAGAIGVTFLIYNISKVKGKISVITLLLSGVALSSLLSSLISLMMIFKTHDLAKVYFWIMGGLSSASWANLMVIAPTIIIIIIVSYFFMTDLNILSLGEERASQLGVQTEKVKKILLILASFIAAAAVSVSGIIGFVGLITPHIMRLIVGPDHKILYPTATISGGIVMLFSDTIARMILTPREIPVGIITSIIGVPFFMYLLLKSKKQVF